MRSVLALSLCSSVFLGLLMSLCASADAATVHRHRPRQHVILSPGPIPVRPSPGVTPPVRFSVPGWSDEETRHWLDSATSCAYCG